LVERFRRKIFRYPEMQPLNVLFNIPLGWWDFVGMVMYSFHVYHLNVICHVSPFIFYPQTQRDQRLYHVWRRGAVWDGEWLDFVHFTMMCHLFVLCIVEMW
jgi:hypothetical protein